MSLVLAHISDLHVSRFGEHLTSLQSRRKHGAHPGRHDWDVVRDLGGWRIEKRERQMRLVDASGAVHERKRVEPGEEARACDELAEIAHERMRTEHALLAAKLPSADEVEQHLITDPHNTNLLFLRAAHRLRRDRPDWVVITGDLTDDGIGYDLIASALAPFLDDGRVLAVPGNHDIYDTPPLLVPGHLRKRRAEKRALWNAFVVKLGLPATGPWIRELGEGALMCGLDSAIPPRTPLSASGAVEPDCLRTLSRELAATPPSACRLAMVHHHVVNLPTRAIGLAPWQLGIRLRNAKHVYDWLCEHRFQCVLNGHRHVGYRYHPPRAPLFVSAPSATLGCRSGATAHPYYWRIEIKNAQIQSVEERPLT